MLATMPCHPTNSPRQLKVTFDIPPIKFLHGDKRSKKGEENKKIKKTEDDQLTKFLHVEKSSFL